MGTMHSANRPQPVSASCFCFFCSSSMASLGVFTRETVRFRTISASMTGLSAFSSFTARIQPATVMPIAPKKSGAMGLNFSAVFSRV